MTAAIPSPPRFWWLKRIAAVYVFALILLVSLTALWIWRGQIALRNFERRLRTDGGPATVAEVVAISTAHADQLPPGAGIDATTFMVAAAPLGRASPIPESDPVVAWHENLDPRQPLTLEEAANMRRWLSWQISALDTARPLLDGRPLWFGVTWGPSLAATTLPHINPLSHIADAIIDQARLQHLEGDDAASIEGARQILRVGDSIREPPIIGAVEYNAALYIQDKACDLVESCAGSLKISKDDRLISLHTRPTSAPAAASRRAVKALLAALWEEDSSRRDAQKMFNFERLMSIDLAESATAAGFIGVIERAAGRHRLQTRDDGWYPVARRGVALSDQFAAAKLSWEPPDAQIEGSHLYRFARDVPPNAFPSFRKLVHREFARNTRRRACATLLALRLFELDHGRVPEQLEELVPEYLPAVPKDLTSEGAPPLTYIHTDDVIALYPAHAPAGSSFPTTLPFPLPRDPDFYPYRDVVIVYRGHEHLRRSSK